MPAIYPVFERPLPGADSFNGNSLSRCLTQLDEIAAVAKVPALSRFIDSAAMAYEVLDEEQLGAIAMPPVKWIQPEEGLLTLRACRRSRENVEIWTSPTWDAKVVMETGAGYLSGISTNLNELALTAATPADRRMGALQGG